MELKYLLKMLVLRPRVGMIIDPKWLSRCQLITTKLAGILAPACVDILLVHTVLEAECSLTFLFLLEGFIRVFHGK